MITVGEDSFVSLAEADAFVDTLIQRSPWEDASVGDRERALKESTRAINNLAFKYDKTDPDQTLEFPRNQQTTIPNEIKWATIHNAMMLLDGVTPESEVQRLSVTSRRFSSVGTTYDPRLIAEYVSAGLVSFNAWNFLLPFFSDHGSVRLHRAS